MKTAFPLILCALLAACGGGGGESQGATQPVRAEPPTSAASAPATPTTPAPVDPSGDVTVEAASHDQLLTNAYMQGVSVDAPACAKPRTVVISGEISWRNTATAPQDNVVLLAPVFLGLPDDTQREAQAVAAGNADGAQWQKTRWEMSLTLPGGPAASFGAAGKELNSTSLEIFSTYHISVTCPA